MYQYNTATRLMKAALWTAAFILLFNSAAKNIWFGWSQGVGGDFNPTRLSAASESLAIDLVKSFALLSVGYLISRKGILAKGLAAVFIIVWAMGVHQSMMSAVGLRAYMMADTGDNMQVAAARYARAEKAEKSLEADIAALKSSVTFLNADKCTRSEYKFEQNAALCNKIAKKERKLEAAVAVLAAGKPRSAPAYVETISTLTGQTIASVQNYIIASWAGIFEFLSAFCVAMANAPAKRQKVQEKPRQAQRRKSSISKSKPRAIAKQKTAPIDLEAEKDKKLAELFA